MRETDIRSEESFSDLLESSEKAASQVFTDSSFLIVGCPACGEKKHTHAFRKIGYFYQSCAACGSLYMSPRPPFDRIAEFYAKLDAFGPFYESSSKTRMEKIIQPRARMIVDTAASHGVKAPYCDVGCGCGDTIGEVAVLDYFPDHFGIEPSKEMAMIARSRGMVIVPFDAENCRSEGEAGLVTSFEVMEHVFSPMDFISAANRLLMPSGIFIFSTLTVDGWDISELWEHHKSVCPPMHINLMSVSGIVKLMDRCGMGIIELSTPGRLDVDILKNALDANPGIPVSRFARAIASAPEATRNSFQSFLAEHRMSSHVMVVARKRS